MELLLVICYPFKLIFDGFSRFFRFTFNMHLFLGLFLRFSLVIYGTFLDAASTVRYTDVDYKVFNDAARHVMNGESPYDRHTYRYSPIIAWMLLPNILFNENFGKYLFSFFDILIAISIRSFVLEQLDGKINAKKVAKYCTLFWIYNPFSVAISTRGNADSVSSLFIILSLYFLQAQKLSLNKNAQFVLAGLFLGLSIHLRLYPILFSFPMYLSLADCKINRNTSILSGITSLIIPNRKQLIFTVTTVATFVMLTYGMYMIYGYKFLFETYIYHLFRKDTRHNFSLFFYHSYLRMGDATFDFITFISKVFVAVIMVLLSIAFGSDSRTLPFALFCQTWVLVTYNSVVTSQYSIWYLSLMCLILHELQMPPLDGARYLSVWITLQALWLAFAFLLEFLCHEVYLMLWMTCTLYFISNVMTLHYFIHLYKPGHGFGIVRPDPKTKDD